MAEECRFRSTRKKIRSNDTSEHVKFIFPSFFLFTGTGTRMKFKWQSVSCFFPFFFFFFSFDFHGMKADGRSIGQGIYDVFEHSPISRHVACAPPLYFAMTYRSPYDEDTSVTDCHVPSTLSLFLSDDIEILRRILLIISITFPLRI